MAPTRPSTRTSIPLDEFMRGFDVFSTRIEKTENDFIGHLSRVEDKLGQLVDLTKQVAILQQQQSSHNDQMSEMRSQIRDFSTKVESSITRIHQRLDDIQAHQRDKMELHEKDIALRLQTLSNTVDKNDKDFRQWLNYGRGAWFLLVIVGGIGYAGLVKWVDTLDKDRQEYSQTNIRLQKLIDQHDGKVGMLEAITKETSQAVRNLQNNQRDFEDFVRNKK